MPYPFPAQPRTIPGGPDNKPPIPNKHALKPANGAVLFFFQLSGSRRVLDVISKVKGEYLIPTDNIIVLRVDTLGLTNKISHFFYHLRGSVPLCQSHTRTVLRECFKGDEACQWKRPKFDLSPHQNPITDLSKNWQA